MLIPTRSRSGAPPSPSSSSGVLGDPQAGAHRPLGVVLVRGRHAEHADDRIADELLHDAAVAFDLRPSHLEVAGEHPVDVLGIGRLRERREPDQVAEERRDDLALLPGGRPQWRAALGTELEAAVSLESTDEAEATPGH